MKKLYFTLPYRIYKKIVRLEYGKARSKFIVRTSDLEIIGRMTSEDPPNEELFDYEQEMLKKVY